MRARRLLTGGRLRGLPAAGLWAASGRPLWVLPLAAAVSLSAPGAASAAPSLPRLVVHRAPSASDCPDAAALAVAVERVMQQPALDPASTDRFAPVFEVQILRSEEGYTAILQTGGRARQLSDRGATCAELSEALALTLAILLDSEVPPAGISPPLPARVAAPPVPRVRVSPPPRPPPTPRKRWDASFALGAAQTVGWLTPLSAALTGDLSLRFRSGSLGLGALWFPARDRDFTPGIVRLGLAAVTARGCAALSGELEGPRLSLCGEPMLGAIYGSGSGYTPDRDGTSPWFALGATALAEGPVAGPLGWSARATFAVPLMLQRFTVDRRTGAGADGPVSTDVVFESSPVGLLLGAGLRLTIP